MQIVNFLLALLFAVLGLLVLRYPMIISGLNTMSEKRRRYVDIDGMKRCVSRSMLVTATVLLVLGVVGFVVKSAQVQLYGMLTTVFGMTLWIIFSSAKYDRNHASRTVMWISATFIVLVMAGVVALMLSGNRESKVTVSESGVSIDGGLYRRTMQWENIDTVYVTDRLPRVIMKTNGFADGVTMKGHFRLEEWGRCMLFVHCKGAPVVVFHDVELGYTVLNFDDEGETGRLYGNIEKHWQAYHE